jgi:hypothetical protein
LSPDKGVGAFLLPIVLWYNPLAVGDCAQESFINQANVREPWAWLAKGDQSLTLLSPDGFPGVVVVADMRMIVAGILAADIETGPREDTLVEFALAVNQPQAKTGELIEALGKK